MPVKIEDILEHLELSTDTGSSFLNKVSGEIIFINDDIFEYAEDGDLDGLADWEKELTVAAKEINETDNFVKLPTKYDINEYSIMERFCHSIVDDKLKAIMYSSIKGSGAFGRFKQLISKNDLEDEWFRFRTEELKMIAADWCLSNKIQLIAG